jgi:glycosyltransferase involved in cell wall biosynthesis
LGERFTSVAVCSERDREYLRSLGTKAPLHVVANGYERPASLPLRKRTNPPRIGFIGVFDHEPNVAGIRWFAERCWTGIRHAIPDVRLRLVGRLSNGSLKPAGEGIDALGWVDDPTEEMSTWSAMVVPVHIGAGTRAKIAHAFSQKCPVVATSLGAYGYDAEDGHNMFLAETAPAFADACIRAIREPETADAMAERAWQQFLEKFTWDAIRPHVWAAAEECLRASRPTS